MQQKLGSFGSRRQTCLETEKNSIEEKWETELTFGEIELERKYKLFKI